MNNYWHMHKPAEQEKKSGMVCKNAVQCNICRSSADRFTFVIQRQKNPNHIADFVTGIFTDQGIISSRKERKTGGIPE